MNFIFERKENPFIMACAMLNVAACVKLMHLGYFTVPSITILVNCVCLREVWQSRPSRGRPRNGRSF